MPYVKRDIQGQIVALSLAQSDECTDFIDNNSDELAISLVKFSSQDPNLIASDLSMIRVIEDVIDVLISKSLINVTDLPQSVQLKLFSRKNYRKNGTFSTDASDLIKL